MSILGMKIPKLTVLLPFAHFVIATVLIGSLDSMYSRFELEAIDRVDEIQRQERLHPELKTQNKISKEQDFDEFIAMEYRPPAAVKAVYGVELPAAALIGWFWHPPTAHSAGLLQPLLHKLALGMSPTSKILVLDSLLILAIFGQWWVVGSWLDHRVRRNKSARLRRLALTITFAGLVSMILCQATGWLEILANLAALTAALAWLGLLLGAAADLAISVRDLLNKAIGQQTGFGAKS